MRYFYFYALLFILVSGCKKEINETASPSTPSKMNEDVARMETTHQSVTKIDGTVTENVNLILTLKSGEIIQISKPANWNGDLILYAHGYVSAFLPLALPTEAASYVPIFTSLGYAFATTSYSENGLAIQSGIQNIVALRKRFVDMFGQPKHTFMTGGSEGGLVTALAIERYPSLFSGGLPLCGPCGDFQKQINYYGDFRVLFDYFFPGILPGNVINIPDELIAGWQSIYIPKVTQAIFANPAQTIKLLNTAHAAYVQGDNNSISNTVLGLLFYSVFATRDAVAKLNGQPYENITKIYFGTGSLLEDLQLNKRIPRYSADRRALATIQKDYETSGRISLPVVQGHTTLDPIIPFWQMTFYGAKVLFQGRIGFYTAIPVDRYGHCTFTEAEIAGGFALLASKVSGQALPAVQQLVDASRNTNGKIVKSVRITQGEHQ